jgi:hypothetical protein
MKVDLCSWRTDVVVPIGKSLCWVDYYQGILFIDVLADSQSSPIQQQLHYVRLPSQALKYRRLYIDLGALDPFRRVCVTDAGIIKLVCICTKYPPSDEEFTIITWTLRDINRGSWTKDVDTIVGADEFFRICNAGNKSCLPQVRPSFPVVSLVDPDVICFLLKEEDRNLAWMVEVNMRNKVLLSSAIYINEEEEGDLLMKRTAGILSVVTPLSPQSSPLTWLRMPSQGTTEVYLLIIQCMLPLQLLLSCIALHSVKTCYIVLLRRI